MIVDDDSALDRQTASARDFEIGPRAGRKHDQVALDSLIVAKGETGHALPSDYPARFGVEMNPDTHFLDQ